MYKVILVTFVTFVGAEAIANTVLTRQRINLLYLKCFACNKWTEVLAPTPSKYYKIPCYNYSLYNAYSITAVRVIFLYDCIQR